jgi:hypothetical protein
MGEELLEALLELLDASVLIVVRWMRGEWLGVLGPDGRVDARGEAGDWGYYTLPKLHSRGEWVFLYR